MADTDRTWEETVNKLDGLLQDLSAHIDSASKPDQVALQSLGISRAGIKRAYSDTAFEIWGKQHENDPKNFEPIHHLAIMHHARAMDEEKEGKSPDDDWRAAMGHWYTLWRSDEFWQSIEATLNHPREGTEAVAEVRANFPQNYLQIHFDAARDAKQNHRVNFHIDQALNAPFEDTAKEAVRARTYKDLVSTIPDDLWTNNNPDAERADEAASLILSYLRLDPKYESALSDALLLQVRMLNTRVVQVNDPDLSDAKKQELFRWIEGKAKVWKPYFTKMAEGLAPEDNARQDLARWASLNGQVQQALDKLNPAREYFQMAINVGTHGDPSSTYSENQLAELELGAKFEEVQKQMKKESQEGYRRAIVVCSEILKMPQADPAAYYLRSVSHGHLGEYHEALDDLNAFDATDEGRRNAEASRNIREQLNAALDSI